jgi:phage terminase small subunit
MGPAMRALNERQRKFVIAFFHTGKRGPAAAMAGYATLNINQAAYQVWHDQKVQAALREFAHGSQIGTLIPEAFKVLEQALSGNASKEQLKAAGMVMDRTGFHALAEVKVTHEVQSREELIRQVNRDATALGLNAKELLGGATDFVTDVEYKEVTGQEPESELAGTGLEDLE